MRKCFNCKVSSLKNVASLKAHTALTTLFLVELASSFTANPLDAFYRSVNTFFVDVNMQSVFHWKILKMNSITFNNFITTLRSFLTVTCGNQRSSMVNLWQGFCISGISVRFPLLTAYPLLCPDKFYANFSALCLISKFLFYLSMFLKDPIYKELMRIVSPNTLIFEKSILKR